MATQRLVNTNFWKDTYVIDLDPVQKLLFLYFLTNPRTSLAGVYEISIREVAFDTGIDKDMVEKILNKFMVDEKMYYKNGWIVLYNFVKHQRLNPSIVRGIEKAVEELPDWLKEIAKEHSVLYNQQRLIILDNEQTGNSLGTDSPQSEPIEAKEKKRKETKVNLTKGQAAESNKFDKAAYAKAVRADEALEVRAGNATERASSSTVESVRESLVKKGIVKPRTAKA